MIFIFKILMDGNIKIMVIFILSDKTFLQLKKSIEFLNLFLYIGVQIFCDISVDFLWLPCHGDNYGGLADLEL